MPAPITVTTTALLDALRGGRNDAAWEEFDRRYRPLLFRLGLRMGLGEADAADVAQESLLAFYRDHEAGRYERGRGRLRSYLLGVARHRALDTLEQRRRKSPVGRDTLIDGLELPGLDELEALWDEEFQQALLRSAFELLRRSSGIDAKTLEIFEEYGLRGVEPTEVAQRQGVSASTVYAVKSRCLKRLSELREELLATYEEC